MKRIFILLAVALLSASFLIAEESVLIDFSKLAADTNVKVGATDESDAPNQNEATMMDYSNVAGSSYTADQKSLMKTSLALGNWEVILASSSQTVTNKSLSFTQEATSKQFEKVLGVRIHFPVEHFNSWARVKPPFEIPAYEPQSGDDGGDGITGPSRFEDGFGVVKNVGTIKSVGVNVYGLNFPHSLSAILIDNEGVEKEVFLGYLNFDGWGQLRWDNPAYVTEIRNRTLRLYPLYPASTPFVKFGGFLIKRDASQDGGDFIAYFKDVRIIYDKAVLDTERDIDDEALWNIIKDRETAKKTFEMSRFGNNQVLRYLEYDKRAKETEFTPVGGDDNDE